MIKVLLINPPQTFYDGSIGRTIYFPLGLMYLAAVVKDVCHVEIFDCLTSEVETREGNAVTYGASFEEISRVISEKKPDVIGISVPFTSQYRNAERVAIISKAVNPKIVTVFGGPDPSVRFKDILENGYCDYCIVGEGEETFYEFIKKISVPSTLGRHQGLAYKKKGTIQYEPRPFNTNLDVLPFPAFDLVDMNFTSKTRHSIRIEAKFTKTPSQSSQAEVAPTAVFSAQSDSIWDKNTVLIPPSMS